MQESEKIAAMRYDYNLLLVSVLKVDYRLSLTLRIGVEANYMNFRC